MPSSRRGFLRSAGVTPLLIESRDLFAANASGSAGPIRIAFLGGGHAHGAAKVDLIRQSPEWEFAGIWDSDPAVLDSYTRRGVPSLSREQILGDKTIRVVAVESFVPELAPLALAALQAGKHVHLDKPPALTMHDMTRLVETASEARLQLEIGYMWRFNPGVNAALEAARAGWLGEIYQLRGRIHSLIEASERRKLAQFRGGMMLELGGHLIDPMTRLMGRPVRVTPFLRHDGGNEDGLADNTVAVLEWKRALATVESAAMQPRAIPHRGLEILGTRGTAVVSPIEPPTLKIDLAAAAGPYKTGTQTLTWPYRRYADDFAQLARAVRGEGALPVTGAEDLVVHETLLRACAMA